MSNMLKFKPLWAAGFAFVAGVAITAGVFMLSSPERTQLAATTPEDGPRATQNTGASSPADEDLESPPTTLSGRHADVRETHELGAAEATAASLTEANGTKPPRKKLSELTTEERRRYHEGRARHMQFKRMRISNAHSVARDDHACNAGDHKACKRLRDTDQGGEDRRAILTQVRHELSGACNTKDLNACIHRGDLDIAGSDHTGAANWYEKAKNLAVQIKTACDAGQEMNPRKCTRARRAYDAITKREQRLAANDAGGGAGAPVHPGQGTSKDPHAPRLPLSKLMQRANLAPKLKPLPLGEGQDRPAEVSTTNPASIPE